MHTLTIFFWVLIWIPSANSADVPQPTYMHTPHLNTTFWLALLTIPSSFVLLILLIPFHAGSGNFRDWIVLQWLEMYNNTLVDGRSFTRDGSGKQPNRLGLRGLLLLYCRPMAGPISMPVPWQWPLVDPVEACRTTEQTRITKQGSASRPVRGRTRRRRGKNALDARHPAVIAIAQLEKARHVLDARRAQLALRVLDGRLGLRRGVHVLGEDGARQVAPQPAALVRLLLVLGGDPLGRYVAAVLLRVE